MKFFIIVILSFSVPVQAMKRLREAEGKDWDNKLSFWDDCTAGREYKMSLSQAYFLPEKDQNRFRIFSDYLLWAKRMNNDAGVIKDVTDRILRYSNAFIILSDKPFIDAVKKLDINESDVLYLSKGQRQGLWYVCNNLHEDVITIHQPAEFSQKMVQNIMSLPIPIKNKISEKYGKTIHATTKHKLLCGALCLDDKDNRCKCIKAIMCCSSPLLAVVMDLLVKFPLFTSVLLGCSTYVYKEDLYAACNSNLSIFCETSEQAEERLRLVEIPLLQEIECEIAEI